MSLHIIYMIFVFKFITHRWSYCLWQYIYILMDLMSWHHHWFLIALSTPSSPDNHWAGSHSGKTSHLNKVQVLFGVTGSLFLQRFSLYKQSVSDDLLNSKMRNNELFKCDFVFLRFVYVLYLVTNILCRFFLQNLSLFDP